MNGDYWKNFWVEQGDVSSNQDPQQQVFRTLHQCPIPDSTWQETLDYIERKISLQPHHHLLDLGGGNGLITKELGPRCNAVTLVDISDGLLAAAEDGCGNVKRIQADMRTIEFEHRTFDRILLYAALQYLTLPESVMLFRRMFQWLAPDGLLFIGDIPDANLQWDFFNNPKRRSNYFDHLETGQPIVGTWYDRDWLSHLAEDTGFRCWEILDQPESQIYSWFRFDMACQK